MGGAIAQSSFDNEQEGATFADTIWNMFLGGTNPAYPRPFGDVVLDGVDLNIESGGPTGYVGFVNRLRELYASDPVKTYYVAGRMIMMMMAPP